MEKEMINSMVNEMFNSHQAVGRLVPQPQYSCYAELLTAGRQNVNTSIFTDMEALDTHFYQILHIFEDGIETDQVQRSVIYVTFVDGETVKLSIFDYWFNLLFWGLPVSTRTPITSRYLWFHKDITQGAIADYINTKFLKDNRKRYTNIQINNMIDDIMYKFQFIDKFSLYLYNTANNEDTIELMKKDKTLWDCIHCDLSDAPMEDVKDVGQKYTNEGIKRIIASKTHWAAPYFRAKQGLNVKQVREFMFNIGTVPDGNGGVYPYIINGSYCNRGISSVKDYDADGDKARLAQVLSHGNVGKSGAFARILGLNNMDDRLHPDPNYVCNSKHFVKITIKDSKTLSMYKGRFFRFVENGVEYQISQNPLKDNMDLIGKTLLFRSPITCASRAHGHGICYRCYGNLAHTNYDINIGRIASELLSSMLTQRLLSAKHLLETNIKKLMWNQEFHMFFDIDYNAIKPKEDVNFKKFKLILDPIDDEDFEEDFDGSSDSYEKYVNNCIVVDPKGNQYNIGTAEGDPMYLSPELTAIINRKTPDADGLYVLDMETIKDKILFYIEVVNNELGATLDKIKSILNKNSEIRRLETKDAVTQELVDTVIEGGLGLDAVHLEVILSHQCKSADSNLLEPDWELANAAYRMISLNEALKDNPSITVSLMYKDINKALYYPTSFQKESPSVLDLFFMTKPQNYMSMKPTHSNLVEDKEIEGPIKPFTIMKDEFDESDDE